MMLPQGENLPALDLANLLEWCAKYCLESAAMLRQQHAEIVRFRALLDKNPSADGLSSQRIEKHWD